MTYADYTASGRALTFIEDYIRDAVLPLYANTHTESSGTGLQTTRFREEARRIIRDARRRRPGRHAVIFCGSGSTGGDQQARRRPRPAHPGRPRRPLRPARRTSRATSGRSSSSGRTSTTPTSCRGASRSPTWSTIREDAGRPHRPGAARGELAGYADRPLRIGSLLGGLERDRDRLATRGRSRSCCTATARSRSGTSPPPAPYVEIEMDAAPARAPTPSSTTRTRSSSRPTSSSAGPGTPGVLVARRELFRNRVPTHAGRRHGRLRQPARARLPRRIRSTARRAARPRSSSRSAPGSSSSSRSAVGVDGHPRARGGLHPAGDRAWRDQPGHRDPRQPDARRGCRSCRSSSATTAATCTTTSSSRCSTTCSGSSRAAAARAPGRTATGCSGSTSRPRTSSSARSRAAARASSRAGSGSTSTTSSARRSSTSSLGAVDLVASDGWRLAARGIGSSRRPASGATRAGPPEPPLSLARHPLRHGRAALPGASPPRARVAPGGPPG